jgi:hypothetical protein
MSKFRYYRLWGRNSVYQCRRTEKQTPFGRRLSTYLIYESYTTARSHRCPRIHPVALIKTEGHTHHHESFTPRGGSPQTSIPKHRQSSTSPPSLLQLEKNSGYEGRRSLCRVSSWHGNMLAVPWFCFQASSLFLQAASRKAFRQAFWA